MPLVVDEGRGHRSVLVVGTGEIADAVARRLASRGDLRRLVRADHAENGTAAAVSWREPRELTMGVRYMAHTREVRVPSWSALLAAAETGTVVLIAAGSGVAGVLGAMRLLSACRQCATVRRIVVVSDARVYACGPSSPSCVGEEAPTATSSKAVRDLAEIERLARGVEQSGIEVIVLRLAPVVGPGTDSPLARLLAAEIPLKPTGYDARLQLLHIDDATAAIESALTATVGGTFNIAGSGVTTLGQIARQRGQRPAAVPHPLLARAARAMGVAGLSGEDIALLRFGRCLDTRRAATVLGFTAAYTTAAAVADHLGSRGRESSWMGLPRPGEVARTIGRIADTATALTGLPRPGEIDEYGFDPEFLSWCGKRVLEPLFEGYLGLDAVGLDNVPDTGRAMIVANHSGTIPLDMIGLGYALGFVHPARRAARVLGGDLVGAFPYIGDVMHRLGCVPACHDDAARLLAAEELVVVCPEGYKGLGKPYSQRYRLQRFGRGGFVRAALLSGAPLIPAAVFGAEEFYPMLSQARPLAKLLGVPYFPITPTFPWLGPLGLIPRRSRLSIEFGPPIPTAHLGPDAVDDAETVLDLCDQVRAWIQDRLDARRGETGA
ncbi:1-acyl-sn-glycerol-3-phosphate acyltransferase [Nocardia sp. CDC160]|uniref:1-acyl-sn-glycerol-3-phosphate acyltransferase n=1 Tax=Nocardia sp. CDC160 TaxID=3112166 RepID=UPI002DBD190F|nr:1-acyl-sn-glycerol-3-phosphate acyltransferase [Nocardia sp. CDC160]MEC3917891.1 1-acyl-sn-glycerol-3-phosphate acyltransferase [Nocardia sp. CDC160]